MDYIFQGTYFNVAADFTLWLSISICWHISLKKYCELTEWQTPIMVKELILILPSAQPWLQCKVPKLSGHFPPSSLTKLSSCWCYHFPLHSWQTVRHDSASLPHSDTLSEVTRASCGVLGFWMTDNYWHFTETWVGKVTNVLREWCEAVWRAKRWDQIYCYKEFFTAIKNRRLPFQR